DGKHIFSLVITDVFSKVPGSNHGAMHRNPDKPSANSLVRTDRAMPPDFGDGLRILALKRRTLLGLHRSFQRIKRRAVLRTNAFLSTGPAHRTAAASRALAGSRRTAARSTPRKHAANIDAHRIAHLRKYAGNNLRKRTDIIRQRLPRTAVDQSNLANLD